VQHTQVAETACRRAIRARRFQVRVVDAAAGGGAKAAAAAAETCGGEVGPATRTRQVLHRRRQRRLGLPSSPQIEAVPDNSEASLTLPLATHH